MVASQSTYSQGIYGLVSNLGSLVVRTIFQVHPSLTSSWTPFVHTMLCCQDWSDFERSCVETSSRARGL